MFKFKFFNKNQKTLEHLSDFQLYFLLTKYGIKFIDFRAVKREMLLKKLTEAIEIHQKKTQENAKALMKFSDDEES